MQKTSTKTLEKQTRETNDSSERHRQVLQLFYTRTRARYNDVIGVVWVRGRRLTGHHDEKGMGEWVGG